MSDALSERLRAHGFRPPDYDGGGLVNVASTVLELCGARSAADPRPLRGIEPALLEGVRNVVLVLCDGLGSDQLQRLAKAGDVPFLSRILDRAAAHDAAQLIDASTIFPSTTAAAITTLQTARTPQEHGNIAYFLWLEEFGVVAQMLRWGPAAQKRGSFFDDRALDPRSYAKVPSIHRAIRDHGGRSYIVEPEIFRTEAMTRMHGAEATYVGYLLPSTMGVRVRQLLDGRAEDDSPMYIYAYWSGVDTVAHWYGPRGPEHAVEAALFDRDLERALGDRPSGDTLVIVTADHGHASVDPERLIDLEADVELRALLRNPIAGEPRVVFLHTDHAAEVRAYLEHTYPGTFFLIDREEAIAAGLFGRGDPALVRARVGEVLALIGDDRGASVVRVDGQVVRHRGSHGGMTADEMRIPVLLWRA
ncbi:MAG TPA: alkaline phosphatase family protein [Candidatus Limnocylindria bacterium]|nr:alkaline phosphatase family protein [Candidatus Limnocylindria bacterium]